MATPLTDRVAIVAGVVHGCPLVLLAEDRVAWDGVEVRRFTARHTGLIATGEKLGIEVPILPEAEPDQRVWTERRVLRSAMRLMEDRQAELILAAGSAS